MKKKKYLRLYETIYIMAAQHTTMSPMVEHANYDPLKIVHDHTFTHEKIRV